MTLALAGAREKGFKEYYICQETLDSLFKGNFKSIEELRDFNDLQQSENKYVIINYRIDKEELGTFADIVDCIYIKD
ncbi:MAG: hypothetical protein CFE23_16210 [Flavobacterium sp. BFFFF1]|nr:MAG: hypothetical protein CFE23_16210 [Flavobacterium sp. BFFFF1]